ncbi:hypothetical protein PSP6_870008 [Paraburkholderia tropica]|uniref:hypothetical protein n=1 Tax=Paraburkholderia TaxID=1822464 RepID=UPI001CB4669F|nr:MULTISPECIES: hypothetical protein [Paraburkholderia]CAG9240011.1 hypothetical protein PSP6_870008 [Paraburkholderia tropica]
MRASIDMGIFGELWNFLTNATIVMALSRKPVILAGPVQTGPARDQEHHRDASWRAVRLDVPERRRRIADNLQSARRTGRAWLAAQSADVRLICDRRHDR